MFAVVTLLIGGAVAVLLSYPILITLERPVRITPEQAVRLLPGPFAPFPPFPANVGFLLSTAGSISTAFGSLGRVSAPTEGSDDEPSTALDTPTRTTPLVFEVADFKADKSAGKITIDASIPSKIGCAGQAKAGAIHVIPMKIALRSRAG